MKKIITLAAAMIAMALPASAQESVEQPEAQAKVNVSFNTRIDFDYDNPSEGKHTSKIEGRYLNLMVDGQINRYISYNFRQRLNKFEDMKSNCFGATDFIYLDYKPNEKWTLSAGKQVVAIGGYEYDANPINLFYYSMFWRNVGCYQFGISGTYHFNQRHSLLAQICNSPYTPWTDVIGNMYSYNLMWQGKMGWFSTLWSINEFEYAPGRYGNYIALGNRATFDGIYFEFDVMNRYTGNQAFWFDDYSLIASAGCSFSRHFDLFVKGGYEHYRPVPGEGGTVNRPFYGAGLLYYPLHNSKNLRLHLVSDLSYDTDNISTKQISAGLTWYMDIFKK